ncbi:hypothetical protein E1J29_18000 [Xanthomonas hortorum pv. vitians]|nr:hypothetical protein [Xanthomonas hortorum pv. vitians]QEW14003.1 hypothetical protein DYQ48_02210 [Xanthomonas hortorum]NMI28090.1 hypothetical protein [Xanthomonas hortorum pv. vitians]NMI32532.1 hypothetical protein [Xanthomonas hortorum pv. vitians]NMI36893.1 hypothetical protein [Xanthomonas hortorum pv. vitians]
MPIPGTERARLAAAQSFFGRSCCSRLEHDTCGCAAGMRSVFRFGFARSLCRSSECLTRC